jgi:hypothetical protein
VDRDPINKVFVTQAVLKDAQTRFGFDEEVVELPLRGIGRTENVDDDESSYGEDGWSSSDSSAEDDQDDLVAEVDDDESD